MNSAPALHLPQRPANWGAQIICCLASSALWFCALWGFYFQCHGWSYVHFSHTRPFLIHLACWWLVIGVAWLAFRIMRPPSWRKLTLLGIAVPLVCLFHVLYPLIFRKGF